jgi:hypothetical protein
MNPADAGLGLAADAGGRLVADFAADAGGGAGEGRNGGGVVVGLDLDHEVDLVAHVAVGARVAVHAQGVGVESLEHAGVVAIGHEGAVGMDGVGVADHLEERQVEGAAVFRPGGRENLVAAVFGVHLSEGDEFGVRRVAAGLAADVEEVVDLFPAEREAHGLVGLHEGVSSAGEHVEDASAGGLLPVEEAIEGIVDPLGHAVEEDGGRGAESGGGPGLALRVAHGEEHAAFHAPHGSGEAAVGENVVCLGGPGRERSLARHHMEEGAPGLLEGAGFEKRLHARPGQGVQRGGEIEEVDEVRGDRRVRKTGLDGGEAGRQGIDAETGEGRAAGQDRQVHGSTLEGGWWAEEGFVQYTRRAGRSSIPSAGQGAISTACGVAVVGMDARTAPVAAS